MTDEGPERKESEEEQEARLRRLLGEGSEVEDPEVAQHSEDPSDELLREMEEKADRLKAQSRMPEPPAFEFERPAKKPNSAPQDYKGIGIGLSAAYALVGAMMVGFGLGWLVDTFILGAGNIGQLFGALGGCVLGILSVMWLISKDK
ncbi:MAG TPA: hypothetical protein VM328_05540 [Fimbriimonadaceae bacterium]|nr:hypothetical protein [Fimbriimonadaceae bacterium]